MTPTLTTTERRILRAVRDGHTDLASVARRLQIHRVTIAAAARRLRGPDDEPPRLLCALDGMPWALTWEGYQAVVRRCEHCRRPYQRKRGCCRSRVPLAMPGAMANLARQAQTREEAGA